MLGATKEMKAEVLSELDFIPGDLDFILGGGEQSQEDCSAGVCHDQISAF